MSFRGGLDNSNVICVKRVRMTNEIPVVFEKDYFDVHFADKEEGEWLLCLAHTALLGVSQIVYGENNKVLYYNEQYIRSDIYKYVTGR